MDYLREAQAGEPSFCREFSLSDAPETRMNRGGDFSTIYKGIILLSVLTGQGGFLLGNVVSCIAAILFAFILGAFCRELYSDPAIAGNRHHPIGHQ